MKKHNQLEIYLDEKKKNINAPAYMPFVEQPKNIDRSSTLYSFEGSFELSMQTLQTSGFWLNQQWTQNIIVTRAIFSLSGQI